MEREENQTHQRESKLGVKIMQYLQKISRKDLSLQLRKIQVKLFLQLRKAQLLKRIRRMQMIQLLKQ